jgi:Putative ATPase subunit of terminase (gpP-like)
MKFVETPEEFEEWCFTHGYSKDDLAEILGVTRQTIYNWTHRPPYRSQGNLSKEIKRDLEARERTYRKIPRMLSFALFAIEAMAPQNVFGGRRLRKRTKRI